MQMIFYIELYGHRLTQGFYQEYVQVIACDRPLRRALDPHRRKCQYYVGQAAVQDTLYNTRSSDLATLLVLARFQQLSL